VLPVFAAVDSRSPDVAAEPVPELIVAAAKIQTGATAALVPPVPADDGAAPPAFAFARFADSEAVSTRWRHPTTVIPLFVLVGSRADL
jgi:hypothetical protein